MSSPLADFDDQRRPFTLPREIIALDYNSVPLSYLNLKNRTFRFLLQFNIKMTVGDIIRAGTNVAIIKSLGVAGSNDIKEKVSLLLKKEKLILGRKKRNGWNASHTIQELKRNQPIFSRNLPDNIKRIPIHFLNVEAKVYQSLMNAKITDIAALDSLDGIYKNSLYRFSSEELDIINTILIALYSSLKQENSIDWCYFWKIQKIEYIPANPYSHISYHDIFNNFSTIVEKIIEQEFEGKYVTVLKNRLGLAGQAKKTLEEVGNALGGISRERVRQIEERALQILQAVLLEEIYVGKSYRIHPLVHKIAKKVYEAIKNAPFHVLLEKNIYEIFGVGHNEVEEKAKATISILLSIIDVKPISFNYPHAEPAWGYAEKKQHKWLEDWLRRVDDLLTRETVHPLSQLQILVSINSKVQKAKALHLQHIQAVLDLCSTVEQNGEDLYWGKAEFLKGRGNQVERLLTIENRPMSIGTITNAINHLTLVVNQRSITERNMAVLLTSDERFVPIGRSGQWALSIWKHINTQPVIDLIEECLMARNKPATTDELYEYVSERRTTNKNSIGFFLTTNRDRFLKLGLKMWGLTKWANDEEIVGDILTSEKVAEYVATLFEEYKTEELDYRVLKEKLISEFQLNEYECRIILAKNPVVKVIKAIKGDKRIAVFQHDYKNALQKGIPVNKFHRGEARPILEKTVYELLDGSPHKELELRFLMQELYNRYEKSETSLYQYISQMNFVETMSIPHSPKKICRLKTTAETDSSPTTAKTDSSPTTAKTDSSPTTTKDWVKERVYAILEAAPGQSMRLSDLIERLQKEKDIPKNTLYSYISHLDYVESEVVSKPGTKIYRLKKI